MPASRLILLVHAATDATRRAAFARRDDRIEPWPLGKAAALPSPALALTSPATPAVDTAMALGLRAMAEPALRDLDVGGWAGVRLAEIAPNALAAWRCDPAYEGHGGESLKQLHDRIRVLLEASSARRGTIVAVTHAAVVRAAIATALEAAPSAFWRIDAPPLHALDLRHDGRRWALRGFGPIVSAINASGE